VKQFEKTGALPKKGAFLLVLSGILLPLVLFPFTTGWSGTDGFLKNLCHGRIQLWEKRENPIFQVVQKGEEDPAAQVIQLEDSKLFLEFGPTTSISEISRIIKVRFPKNNPLPEDPIPGRLKFLHWSIRPAKALPYGYVFYSRYFQFHQKIGF